MSRGFGNYSLSAFDNQRAGFKSCECPVCLKNYTILQVFQKHEDCHTSVEVEVGIRHGSVGVHQLKNNDWISDRYMDTIIQYLIRKEKNVRVWLGTRILRSNKYGYRYKIEEENLAKFMEKSQLID